MNPTARLHALRNVRTLCAVFLDEIRPLAEAPGIRKRMHERWTEAVAEIRDEVEVELKEESRR
jgi:hypothetical protein